MHIHLRISQYVLTVNPQGYGIAPFVPKRTTELSANRKSLLPASEVFYWVYLWFAGCTVHATLLSPSVASCWMSRQLAAYAGFSGVMLCFNNLSDEPIATHETRQISDGLWLCSADKEQSHQFDFIFHTLIADSSYFLNIMYTMNHVLLL